MSTSGINFAGLGTGIDTEAIIQKFIEIDRRPEKIMRSTQARLQQRQTAYATLTAKLIGLQSAAGALNRLRSFDLVTARSSDDQAVSVTAESGAQTGTHVIQVTQLARAHRIASAAQSSRNTPLGFTGQIILNGRAITVNASDTLETLVASINAAQAGVTASIIAPSANEFYLTLGSAHTGERGRISLSDTAGGAFLSGVLGFFTPDATSSVRQPVGENGAGSLLFTDSVSTVGTLQGQTAPASGLVKIADVTVKIDLATDSLSAIAAKINQADIPGVSASVVSVADPITGTSRFQLQIQGTQKFTDDNNVLANLGIVQRDLGRELVAAQDAQFSIDGIQAVRPTNTFSDAISGVTLTLRKENASAEISVATDVETIKTNISSFVKAFNDVMDFVASQAQFDPQTGATGPLFADGATQSLLDGLISGMTSPVSGLPDPRTVPGTLTILAQIGVTLNQNARLVVNEAELTKALTENRANVARLFRADGVTTSSMVQFVSVTEKTQASGPMGFSVRITQPARQATLLVDIAQTGPLAEEEVLTFGGALFGTSAEVLTGGRQLRLAAGSTLSDVVAQINADPNIGRVLSASIDEVTGKLKLTSRQYGSRAEFAVVSGVPASATSTGIGTTIRVARGQDVAGTINGEVARGDGQFLTGSQTGGGGVPDGKALGLQLRITATEPGDYGVVRVTSGVANVIRNYISMLTDAFSGTLTTGSQTIERQIKDIDENIAALNERLKETERTLRLRFAAMESAVTRIRAAQAGLAQLAALNNNPNR